MIDFFITEPLKSNRWIIETSPLKINPYCFRKYNLFNEGEKIILKTEFMETVEHFYNPEDLMNITDITINYLDPVGETVNGLKMSISGVNFEKKHSYKEDELLITKMRFIIEKIQPLYSSTTEQDEK